MKLKYHTTDEGDGLPLVDMLSTGNTIEEGREEVRNIVEQIYFDMDGWVKSLASELSEVKESGNEVTDYNTCRKFVSEWLWDSSKYGCERKAESFDNDQCRDAACMIESFVRSRLQPTKAYNIGLQSYENSSDDMVKKISCQFFRHWWNSPGNNTEQGFDVWWKQNKHKYLQPAKTICVNCDELKSCSNICMDCVKKIVDENMQPPKDSTISDEQIEKCSYQYLSDVSESTNTERKYEKIGFIKGAKAALSGLQPAKDSKLTDEEIEKWANMKYENWLIFVNNASVSHPWKELLVEGAKAALSGQITKWIKNQK